MPSFSASLENAIHEALAAANKRIGNILRKSAAEAADSVDPALLQEPAEQELWQALQAAEDALAPMLKSRDYIGVLRALAGLRKPVDAFFDKVLVPPGTPMSQSVPGNRADIKPGETIFIVARIGQGDKLTAARVQVSTNGVKPTQ